VHAEEIRSKEFFVDARGYERNEVRAFLRAVADEIESLQRELSEVRASGHGPADAIDPVDLLGQHVAGIVRASRDSAEQLIQEAQNAAAAYRALADEQARRVQGEAEERRARATQALAEAEAYRAQVVAACDDMTAQLVEAVDQANTTIQSLRDPIGRPDVDLIVEESRTVTTASTGDDGQG
jgi:DivIVA domain-containing protein